MSVFIIAEAGVAHAGRLDHALRLVAMAADAECDAVKFQAFDPTILGGADYAKRAMLKSLALTGDELKILAAEARYKGIEFMCTPMDMVWAHFLVKELRVKKFKIGSAQAGDRDFVQYVAEYGLPVIISDGMCKPEEFVDSVRILQAENCPVTAMKCISRYPTPDYAISLEDMTALGERAGVEVGFSSHCPSIWPTVAAVYAGAVVVENHITLDGVDHPDASSSLSWTQLQSLVREVRYAEAVMGAVK